MLRTARCRARLRLDLADVNTADQADVRRSLLADLSELAEGDARHAEA